MAIERRGNSHKPLKGMRSGLERAGSEGAPCLCYGSKIGGNGRLVESQYLLFPERCLFQAFFLGSCYRNHHSRRPFENTSSPDRFYWGH